MKNLADMTPDKWWGQKGDLQDTGKFVKCCPSTLFCNNETNRNFIVLFRIHLWVKKLAVQWTCLVSYFEVKCPASEILGTVQNNRSSEDVRVTGTFAMSASTLHINDRICCMQESLTPYEIFNIDGLQNPIGGRRFQSYILFVDQSAAAFHSTFFLKFLSSFFPFSMRFQ